MSYLQHNPLPPVDANCATYLESLRKPQAAVARSLCEEDFPLIRQWLMGMVSRSQRLRQTIGLLSLVALVGVPSIAWMLCAQLEVLGASRVLITTVSFFVGAVIVIRVSDSAHRRLDEHCVAAAKLQESLELLSTSVVDCEKMIEVTSKSEGARNYRDQVTETGRRLYVMDLNVAMRLAEEEHADTLCKKAHGLMPA